MRDDPEPRPTRRSNVQYAFVSSMEDAHRVASHIVHSTPKGTFVGFNQSLRGEGYVVVDASIDIAAVVRAVTAIEPLRVVTHDELSDEPDGFGVIQGP